ncbi:MULTISPECIES: hypothetical protein [unclassified Pseudomonas]|uniref:hypothetical protein n=1 Tax=unclassified Pseudomonas TaxID=196821 RepID=UPI001940C6F9|nr:MULTISPECIES: hypothetical protein [unclassified Pseudomonas]MCE0913141.1 hypothetical protein [Pseudomonas sp. NMI760_13]MCF1487749.1 hypothetical protein [Pseudomonas sp. AA27]MCP8635947.1 hypothetical protein [Pseudomonas sp. DVZ6]MDD7786539.1 hypothetical protein [Pseudomonas sp. DVZ24]BCJ09539.1 hypothetical protein PRtIB026_A08370 [Pseudomonas sp. RtIB026]
MKRLRKVVPGLLIALALNACAQQSSTGTPQDLQVNLAAQTLSLVNHEGRCALRKADQSLLELDMPWPCQLSPERLTGKPRVEHFNGSQIIIVSHVEADPSQPGRCNSQYQAVRLVGASLEPSILAKGGSCSTGPVDQKDFVGLFQW